MAEQALRQQNHSAKTLCDFEAMSRHLQSNLIRHHAIR